MVSVPPFPGDTVTVSESQSDYLKASLTTVIDSAWSRSSTLHPQSLPSTFNGTMQKVSDDIEEYWECLVM